MGLFLLLKLSCSLRFKVSLNLRCLEKKQVIA